jgi:hypothetical protein
MRTITRGLVTAHDIARPVVRTDQSITFAVWANVAQVSNVDQIVVNAGPLSLFFRDMDTPGRHLRRQHRPGASVRQRRPAEQYRYGATPLASTGSLMIGAKGSGFYFGGTIDDVRVWQGVLNTREIAYLYSHS